MDEREGHALTRPSCLAQVLVTAEAGTRRTSVICYNCGDPVPIPVADPAPAATVVAEIASPSPRPAVVCPTCLTAQCPPGDHGIFPCRHCGRLINTVPAVHDPSPGGGPVTPVLPIPDRYQPPPLTPSAAPPRQPALPVTPVERAVGYVFDDLIGRNTVTAACLGTAALYGGLLVLIVVASLRTYPEVALAAAAVLLPIAGVLVVLPAVITAGLAANPEWIVIWAVAMVPVLIFLVGEGIFAAAVVPVMALSILVMLKLVAARKRG
jgi:hypothetical protein